jgi:hypothetical protein
VVADASINPVGGAENIRDDDEKITGITFTQSSETECAGDSEINYSMTTKLNCDEDVTAEGGAIVKSLVISENGCEYTVELSHAAGCPTFKLDIDAYMGWLSENQWVIGVIYLVFGPVIALFGLQWFPYVTASLVAIFVIGITASLSLAFGWMATTTGTIITCVVALILGVLAGILIRRNIWIMIGLLGLVAGFFSGSLVYALIFSLSGWSSVWGFWLISVLTAAVGCVASCYLGKAIVLLSTSLVGAYLFMRSWTLFFPGNYPSEAELMSEDFELDTTAIFWVFIGVFILSFITSVIFQKKRDISHEDLDEYDRQ